MDDPDETLATARAAPADDALPELPAERFTVGGELGRGGMGRVVAAYDRALDRTIAIKQALSTDPTQLARFAREARITARLEHASIVPIHETGHDAQGRPYYVMRNIEGQPLSDRIAAATTARERLALVPNVLAAVEAAAFAHARGVIHRDIKPLNILVGAYGETLLIDWGLARELASSEEDVPGAVSSGDPVLTEAGHAYGTPGYMAPEQARGEAVDTRADVYQLGATLFHVLAGVPPFEGIARSEWIARSVLGAAPQVERIGPEVPVELVAIVTKAMRAEACDRYRDAGELAVDLRRFLTGQLVAAHRYTPRQRIARFVRRHRIAVAATTVAVVAAAVLATLAIGRILSERALKNAQEELAIERADQLVLDQATVLVGTDPTRAIALLATLPANSPRWPHARDVAAAAAAGGIRHGVQTPHGHITVLAIAPDGHRLLSAGNDATIQVHELATTATRTFEIPRSELSEAAWIDDGTIAFTEGKVIGVLDLASAKVHTIATGQVTNLWPAGGQHLRALVDHQLVDFAITGERTVLAEHAVKATCAGELALFDTGTSLQLLAGTRTLVLRDHAAADLVNWDTFAIAPDGAHVAALLGGTVYEFATATGALTHELAVPPQLRVLYGIDRLYGITRDTRVTLTGLDGKRPYEVLETTPITWSATTREVMVIADTDGEVIAIDRVGIHHLFGAGTTVRVVALHAGSPYLAIGSDGGAVSWWDLRAVAPSPLTVAPQTTVCGYDADAIYAVDSSMSAVRIDRATGTATRIGGDSLQVCVGMVGHHLIVSRNTVTDRESIDVRTGAVFALYHPVIDHYTNTLYDYLEDSREIFELPHGELPAQRRWQAPGDVIGYVAAGRWLAAQLSNGAIVRIDPDGATTFAWMPGNLLDISLDGAVWSSADRVVWRWQDALARPVTTLPPTTIMDVFSTADGIGMLVRDHGLRFMDDRGLRLVSDVRATGVFANGVMMVATDNSVATVVYPVSGVRVPRTFLNRVTNAALEADGSIAIGSENDRYSDYITIYRDPVPLDPAATRAWVLGATNATFDRDSDSMTWR